MSEKVTKPELYLFLQTELEGYRKMMGEAIDSIMASEVTKYPVFVIHKQEVELGIPIIDKEKVQGNWSVNVSTLEEFVSKQIIHESKVRDFKATYKSPDSFICIFSLSTLGAQFIFLPRKV